MRKIFLLFLLALAQTVQAATFSPTRPADRLSDGATVFYGAARARFVQVLRQAAVEQGVSIYVVTVADLGKANPAALADQLRASWIAEPLGIIVFYARSHNRISLSLTEAAFARISSKVKLEKLASDIDRYNLEGPQRSIPHTVDVLTILLDTTAPPAEKNLRAVEPASALLIQIPILITLAALIWGIRLFYRFLVSHNIFSQHYEFTSKAVAPRLGALNGGSNMASGKFG